VRSRARHCRAHRLMDDLCSHGCSAIVPFGGSPHGGSPRSGLRCQGSLHAHLFQATTPFLSISIGGGGVTLATSATTLSPSAPVVRSRASAWATAAVLRCSTPASDPCRISSHPRGGADRRWSTSSRLPVCGVEQGRPRSRVPARARSRRAAAAEVRTPCAARSINRCARQCRARLRTGAASGVNRAKIVALQWFHVPQIKSTRIWGIWGGPFRISMLFNVIQCCSIVRPFRPGGWRVRAARAKAAICRAGSDQIGPIGGFRRPPGKERAIWPKLKCPRSTPRSIISTAARCHSAKPSPHKS
jgi:hypothetical protein